MPNEIRLTNDAIKLLLSGMNEIDVPTAVRIDSERRLEMLAHSELVAVNAAGVNVDVLAENDGTLRNQLVLWNYTGGAQIRAAGEPTTGELHVLFHGKDEAGNPDEVRTDPGRVLWNRPYPAYEQVDPVEIPAAEGVLWNPGAAATELYEVSFLVVNNDAGGAAVTVSVGVDLGAGGGLAAPEYWMFNEVIPYPGTSGWRGPFIMAGDDDVRGIASVANDASIHWRIRRVDTGA